MKKSVVLSSILALVLSFQSAAFALPSTHEEIQESTEVFSEMLSDSDTRIPAWLMRRSKAIAILTNLKQGGFIFGGRGGDGVMLKHFEDGSWSDPAFVKVTGGSVGLQVGFKSTDLILLFPSEAALDDVLSGSFELGGSVSGAGGPVGASVSDSFEGFDDEKIYVYSRSQGLFGGVALEGSDLSVANKANRKFYGRPITVRQLFTTRSSGAPSIVNDLKAVLQNAERY